VKAKERHRRKLIEFLGNPENEFPTRYDMAKQVLGFKDSSTLYRHFSVQELCDLEAEALALRRTKYASQLAAVDVSLLKDAKKNTKAARLAYQRFEDWAPRKRIETDVKGEVSLKVEYVNDWRSNTNGNNTATLPTSGPDDSEEPG
jgi:hypothetical protein